jgi:hypothetical protein
MKKPAASCAVPGCKNDCSGVGFRITGDRKDREDRADRDIGLDVGGAIERIDCQRQRLGRIDQDRPGVFLRTVKRNRHLPDGLQEDTIGHDIEILLDIAIGIRTAARGCKADIERALGRQLADLQSGLGQRADGCRDSFTVRFLGE